MMMMCGVGIAAQHPPAGLAGLSVLSLGRQPGRFRTCAGSLAGSRTCCPHPVTNVTWRELGPAFTSVAAEIKRRQESTSDDQAPIYIFIYDIQRFRDLRKSDDDFGYSRYDEDKPVPPSKLFSDVLRDGPPVGVHTIIWCDSVNNLNRTLDRQGMKEFENRILFQMSANDSSTLIDNPAASKLGENRALYYSEEANRIEKFRPYGVPELPWLEEVKKRFEARPRPASTAQAGGLGNGAAAPLEPASLEDRPVAGNGDATASLAASSPPEEVANPPVETL